jgi:hypothetical protein
MLFITPLTFRSPICSVQAINKAVIVTETSGFDKLETKTFVKAVGAGIVGQWIDENRCYKWVCETSGDRKLHHLGAIAFA